MPEEMFKSHVHHGEKRGERIVNVSWNSSVNLKFTSQLDGMPNVQVETSHNFDCLTRQVSCCNNVENVNELMYERVDISQSTAVHRQQAKCRYTVTITIEYFKQFSDCGTTDNTWPLHRTDKGRGLKLLLLIEQTYTQVS